MWLRDAQLTAASVPELVAWLADPHYGRRAQAARTLANRDPEPDVIWTALLAARADESWMVRMQVPRAAVRHGAPPEQAVPALRELLDDPDEVVQGYAAWALERFGQGSEDDMLAELVRQGRRKPRHRRQAAPGTLGEPK